MQTINRSKVLRQFGIPPNDDVTWTRSYVQDGLEVHEDSTDELTVLVPQHIKAVRAQALFAVPPALLALGATHTVVVDEGDQPLVFVPVAAEDIPQDAMFIRGYLA